jgi:membrane fusion protein, heavy metal efflux system
MSIIKYKMKIFILAGMVALFAACHNITEQQDPINYTLNGDTIQITGKSSLLGKLKTETITPEPYKMKLSVSGIVRAIPNNYAEVASPFAGRITRSFVRLGQHVDVNSPIFEISSPSFFEAGKAYYQFKQEMLLAEKNLKRQKDLLENGVGILKDVEEAEVTYELTKRDFENSIASLSVYHVNPGDLVLGQPLIVRSPIRGEIVENKIVLGQYLKEDAEPVAIVAELSKVWVAGQLKEKDIKSIHKSDEVEISLTGSPDIHFKGKVYHISEILDEETRSVQVFIECDNKDRNMKPGMYVTAQFSDSSDVSILVPTSSVLQMEESCFIYLQTGKNEFIRQPVVIAGTDNNMTIIKSGLKSGDCIISQGGTLLLEAR